MADPVRISLIIVAILCLVEPAIADDQANLGKDVAACLIQARTALGPSADDFGGGKQNAKIDAYSAQGKIYFNNPFVDQNPTFAFWKCLRLKGYNIPG